jgi:hypothetical protein
MSVDGLEDDFRLGFAGAEPGAVGRFDTPPSVLAPVSLSPFSGLISAQTTGVEKRFEWREASGSRRRTREAVFRCALCSIACACTIQCRAQ